MRGACIDECQTQQSCLYYSDSLGYCHGLSHKHIHTHTHKQAGVLLGLVFLHLIPEASAMAGFTWELSSLIVGGYLFGMLTEHTLYVCGFEHAHAGHASHSSEEERYLLEGSSHACMTPASPLPRSHPHALGTLVSETQDIRESAHASSAVGTPNLSRLNAQDFARQSQAAEYSHAHLAYLHPHSSHIQGPVAHPRAGADPTGAPADNIAEVSVVEVRNAVGAQHILRHGPEPGLAHGSNGHGDDSHARDNAASHGHGYGHRNSSASGSAVALPAKGAGSLEAGAEQKKGFCMRLMSPVVLNILVGDAFHNVFDGIAIAAAFSSCNGKEFEYVCMRVDMQVLHACALHVHACTTKTARTIASKSSRRLLSMI